jgi:F420-non-reducing hydrogenase iron-sulfur subunit
MDENFKPKITLFHCINAVNDAASLPLNDEKVELRIIKLPCSGMVKDVFLLRAFEAGADAVIVLVCPEAVCRHLEGSLRARKRVERVRSLLDEIGLGGKRLSIFNIPGGDEAAAAQVIRRTLGDLAGVGPKPAR